MSRYKAFVSYVHDKNNDVIDKLHRGIARLAVPAYKLRGRPIFRDRTALKAQSNLWSSIAAALTDSEYLVFCATPDAAQSEWVQREVECFLSSDRTLENIVIVLLEGEISWEANVENNRLQFKGNALPPILKDKYESEPLYIDLRWMSGKKKLSRIEKQDFLSAIATIVARIEAVDKDQIFGADIRYRQTAFGIASLVSLGLVALSVGLSYFFSLATENEALAKEQRDIAIASESEAQRQAQEALAASLRNQAQLSWQNDRLYGAATTARLAATSHFLSQTSEAAKLISQSMFFVAPGNNARARSKRLMAEGTPVAFGLGQLVIHSPRGDRVATLRVHDRFENPRNEFQVTLEVGEDVSGEWQQFDLTDVLAPYVRFGSIPGLFEGIQPPWERRAHLSEDGNSIALCIPSETSVGENRYTVDLISITLSEGQNKLSASSHTLEGMFNGCDYSFDTNTFLLRPVVAEDNGIVIVSGGTLTKIPVRMSEGLLVSSSLSPDGRFAIAAIQNVRGAYLRLFGISDDGQFVSTHELSLLGSTFAPANSGIDASVTGVRYESLVGNITWSTNAQFFAVVERDAGVGITRLGIYSTQDDRINHLANDVVGDHLRTNLTWLSDDGRRLLVLEQGKGLRLRDVSTNVDIFAVSAPLVRGGALNSDQGTLFYHTNDTLHEIDWLSTPGLVEPMAIHGSEYFRADLEMPPMLLSGDEDLNVTQFKDQLGATLWDFENSNWYQVHLKSGPGEVFGLEFSKGGDFALISFDSTSFGDVICLASVPDRSCVHTDKFRRTEFLLERSIGSRVASDGRFAFYTAEGDWSFEENADQRDRITIIHPSEDKEIWTKVIPIPDGQNTVAASLVDDVSIFVLTGGDDEAESQRLEPLSMWKVALADQPNEVMLAEVGTVEIPDRLAPNVPVVASKTYNGRVLLGVPTTEVDDLNVGFEVISFDMESGESQEIAQQNNVVSIALDESSSFLLVVSSPNRPNGPDIPRRLKYLKGGTRVDIIRLQDGKRVYSRDFPDGFEKAFFVPHQGKLRVTGIVQQDGKQIQDYVWLPNELIAKVCSYLGGGIGRQYWQTNVSNSIDYVDTCK